MNSIIRTGWRSALAVFGVALLVQSFIFTVVHRFNPFEVIDGDTPSYLACAEDFRASGNFNSPACLVRPPGYPLLLAVTGTTSDNPAPALRLNHVLAALTAVLFYFLLLQFLNPAPALLWSLLFSVDPLILRYSNTLMTEMPFLFLWVLSLAFLSGALRTGKWFFPLAVCGLLQAAAVLTRPAALFWPVLQAPLLLMFLRKQTCSADRRRLAVQVAAVLVYAAAAWGIPQLWADHNWKVHGYRSVSRVGMDVLHHKAAMILTIDLGCSLDEAHEILNRRFAEISGRDVGALSDTKRDKLYKRVLLETAWKHPVGFARASVRSARRVLFRGAVPEFAAKGQPGRTLHCVLNYINTGWNILLGGLALSFFFVKSGARAVSRDAASRFWIVLAVLSIAYFTLIVTPHGKARYRFPVVPSIYLLAALGFHELRQARLKRYNPFTRQT